MKSFQKFIKETATPEVADVYIDLDGVLVDFHGGSAKVLKKLGLTPFTKKQNQDADDEARWKALDEINNFWLDLSPIPDGLALFKFVEHFTRPSILSAAPSTNFTQARNEKILWVKNNIGSSRVSDIHIVKRSQKKDFAINKDTRRANILIDDYELNCKEWIKAGGHAIHYTSMQSAVSQLKEYNFYK